MSTAFSSVSSQPELFPLTVMTQHGCLLPATPGLTPYAQRTIRRAINLLDKYAWQLRLRIHRRLPHSMLTTFTRVNMKTLPATTQRAAKLCLSVARGCLANAACTPARTTLWPDSKRYTFQR